MFSLGIQLNMELINCIESVTVHSTLYREVKIALKMRFCETCRRVHNVAVSSEAVNSNSRVERGGAFCEKKLQDIQNFDIMILRKLLSE